MWFRNLKIYRLSPDWKPAPEALLQGLAAHAYRPGGALDNVNLGWIPAREGVELAHEVGGQYLLALRSEKKLLPATVINQEARARAQELEAQQGFKPGRRQLKEIKEQVTDELLPRAFSLYRDTRLWLDPKRHWLAVDAAAAAKADEVLGLLSKSIEPFPVLPLYVAQSPAAAMTGWLADDEAPSPFSIDQDTELRASGESRAAIRYVKHTIEPDDVRRHIAAGKQCTRLALTWNDRVSFVLTEALDVKRVAPLDVLKEGGDAGGSEDERLDADFALMAGELSALLNDLVGALGGEQRDR